jgi:hypothetical protein
VAAYQRAIDSEHSEVASKARFSPGVLFQQRGAYNLAEEAYQQAINSGHAEVAPKAVGNLRGLPMRYPDRFRRGWKRLGEYTPTFFEDSLSEPNKTVEWVT